MFKSLFVVLSVCLLMAFYGAYRADFDMRFVRLDIIVLFWGMSSCFVVLFFASLNKDAQ